MEAIRSVRENVASIDEMEDELRDSRLRLLHTRKFLRQAVRVLQEVLAQHQSGKLSGLTEAVVVDLVDISSRSPAFLSDDSAASPYEHQHPQHQHQHPHTPKAQGHAQTHTQQGNGSPMRNGVALAAAYSVGEPRSEGHLRDQLPPGHYTPSHAPASGMNGHVKPVLAAAAPQTGSVASEAGPPTPVGAPARTYTGTPAISLHVSQVPPAQPDRNSLSQYVAGQDQHQRGPDMPNSIDAQRYRHVETDHYAATPSSPQPHPQSHTQPQPQLHSRSGPGHRPPLHRHEREGSVGSIAESVTSEVPASTRALQWLANKDGYDDLPSARGSSVGLPMSAITPASTPAATDTPHGAATLRTPGSVISSFVTSPWAVNVPPTHSQTPKAAVPSAAASPPPSGFTASIAGESPLNANALQAGMRNSAAHSHGLAPAWLADRRAHAPGSSGSTGSGAPSSSAQNAPSHSQRPVGGAPPVRAHFAADLDNTPAAVGVSPAAKGDAYTHQSAETHATPHTTPHHTPYDTSRQSPTDATPSRVQTADTPSLSVPQSAAAIRARVESEASQASTSATPRSIRRSLPPPAFGAAPVPLDDDAPADPPPAPTPTMTSQSPIISTPSLNFARAMAGDFISPRVSARSEAEYSDTAPQHQFSGRLSENQRRAAEGVVPISATVSTVPALASVSVPAYSPQHVTTPGAMSVHPVETPQTTLPPTSPALTESHQDIHVESPHELPDGGFVSSDSRGAKTRIVHADPTTRTSTAIYMPHDTPPVPVRSSHTGVVGSRSAGGEDVPPGGYTAGVDERASPAELPSARGSVGTFEGGGGISARSQGDFAGGRPYSPQSTAEVDAEENKGRVGISFDDSYDDDTPSHRAAPSLSLPRTATAAAAGSMSPSSPGISPTRTAWDPSGATERSSPAQSVGVVDSPSRSDLGSAVDAKATRRGRVSPESEGEAEAATGHGWSPGRTPGATVTTMTEYAGSSPSAVGRKGEVSPHSHLSPMRETRPAVLMEPDENATTMAAQPPAELPSSSSGVAVVHAAARLAPRMSSPPTPPHPRSPNARAKSPTAIMEVKAADLPVSEPTDEPVSTSARSAFESVASGGRSNNDSHARHTASNGSLRERYLNEKSLTPIVKAPSQQDHIEPTKHQETAKKAATPAATPHRSQEVTKSSMQSVDISKNSSDEFEMSDALAEEVARVFRKLDVDLSVMQLALENLIEVSRIIDSAQRLEQLENYELLLDEIEIFKEYKLGPEIDKIPRGHSAVKSLLVKHTHFEGIRLAIKGLLKLLRMPEVSVKQLERARREAEKIHKSPEYAAKMTRKR
eukprot:Rmarinus@m.15471